jgi:hypothetical protein
MRERGVKPSRLVDSSERLAQSSDEGGIMLTAMRPYVAATVMALSLLAMWAALVPLFA